MKIVYCLTSRGRDVHEAMTRLSLATVRATNPDARIEVFCDDETFRALENSNSRLIREADEVHRHPTPSGSPVFRNRFVKTQLGEAIDGAFLFLDADTVVRRPLAAWMPAEADIAGAPNHSRDDLEGQLWADDVRHIQTMKWQIPPTYINGGVLYYAGTPGSKSFVAAWHRLWREGVEMTGRDRDQSALNKAITVSGARLHVLPHACNAQIKVTPSAAKDAAVWHYYFSNGDPPDTDFAAECLRVSPDRPIDAAAVRRLVEADLPWPTRWPMHRLLVNGILKRGRATPVDSALLAGDYVAACRRVAGRLAGMMGMRRSVGRHV